MNERYTTQPSTTWPNYVDIIEHRPAAEGGSWCCGSCPAGKAEERVAEMLAHEVDFWARTVAKRNDPRLVVAKGHSYWIGGLGDYPKGFGGRRWFIRFHTGRIAVTDSLWHQGCVPEEWRAQLPDTATLRNLDDIARYCPQCGRRAHFFINQVCNRCANGVFA